ncbi:hypothetical protein [Pyxidicoccus parkwayensis]|uniref:hypothetical protein n=1 Tax=Pyxidicoccus parkwayensis TaxID=2813578 RepID=UPI001F51336D|nr:hypothetical protein [Pyxidicoccus parkwaysis]
MCDSYLEGDQVRKDATHREHPRLIKRLTVLYGAGHFEVIDPRSREWPQVVAAVQSLL